MVRADVRYDVALNSPTFAADEFNTRVSNQSPKKPASSGLSSIAVSPRNQTCMKVDLPLSHSDL
jgi:hypothetical protein